MEFGVDLLTTTPNVMLWFSDLVAMFHRAGDLVGSDIGDGAVDTIEHQLHHFGLIFAIVTSRKITIVVHHFSPLQLLASPRTPMRRYQKQIYTSLGVLLPTLWFIS
ncbi:hypothetical protein QVD17_08546 [Tagetes erecta]|uniref:Uncharacterized protein n=1 Tax=Tagetes erecta TaxID=13708 RepID=A0AAD8P4N1_TARER|nr:hypothetical protein QVD17_24789 [Tagetes erecta]KAK1431836.1 hypothetical protein QVD17_08546 [Tagetes erecta]